MLVNCGKSTAPAHCGNATWHSCGKHGAVPQNIKHRTPIWPRCSTSRHILQRTKVSTWTSAWAPVFLGALFTVAKMWIHNLTEVVPCFFEWFVVQLQWIFEILVLGHRSQSTEANVFVFLFFPVLKNFVKWFWCTLYVENHWSGDPGQRLPH